MKILKNIKKFFISMFLIVCVYTLTGCGSANFSFNGDGSGSVTLTIAKNYIDEETSESRSVTREEVDAKVQEIINAAEIDSGMEDRVSLNSIKETDEAYLIDFSFMRIQYLTSSTTGAADLGLYTFKNSQDFVQEIDSVDILKEDWTFGCYKPITKFVTNDLYTFDNQSWGDPDAAFVPFDRSLNREMNEDEISNFFSDNGALANDKKGKVFTFFLCDFEGLEQLTFNFPGHINVYGSKNVISCSDNSFTVGAVKQSARVTNSSTGVTEHRDVDCFVGYVYFTLGPNVPLIIFLSVIGVGTIGFIIVAICLGWFKKLIHSKTIKSVKRNGSLYFMLIPAITLLFIFSYLPMGGVSLAFKNYKVNDGIWGSEWASMFGFKNFFDLFTSPASDFGKLMANTFLLALWKFIFGFLIAVLLAVLYSYLRDGLFKKSVQSISYFPYFVSWVVISTIAYVFLATDGGVINHIITWFGGTPINFYASPQYWRFILTATAMWKTAGYSTIVYLAAIVSIDPSLYEAAKLDGAGRVGQLWHVTLPGLAPVIGIQIVFSLGNLVRDDFDQIYTMIRGSSMLRDTTDTIGKIVFENIGNPANYSGVAAMGLLQGLIGLIIVVVTNEILKKRGIQGAY